MIKKNTKFIFEGKDKTKLNVLVGGIPLSKGEVICFHDKNKKVNYKVVDKKIDCMIKDNDQIVDITYVLKKK